MSFSLSNFFLSLSIISLTALRYVSLSLIYMRNKYKQEIHNLRVFNKE